MTAKILVIDDESGIREGVKRALTPQGYVVDGAENGAEGLRKIQSNGFDLVLIDVMMPGVSGIDLIASIHQHDAETVCIIITGYATVELAVRAIKQGAYDFLTKPFTVDDLMIVVNQGLERRKFSLEARRLQTIEVEAQQLVFEKSRLEELDKAKRQFYRLVTHELQAPVAAINNYLQLMYEGYISPEEQRSIIEKCLARTQEELELISDLLELGRLQSLQNSSSGVLKDMQSTLHLELALQQVLDNLQDQATHKNLTLTSQIAPEIPPIQGSPDQFKRVWTNLIGNAIKYTPAGGSIFIQLSANNDQICAEVRDTGIGIPSEDQKQLFTEFFRAGNAKELNVIGTGLGLVIVKRIIEGAGGKITVESQVGKGTTFRFTIPVKPAAA